MTTRTRTKSRRSAARFPIAVPLLLLLAAIPLISASSAASPDSAASPPSALEIQIRQWVDGLSREKPFEAWNNAEIDVQALGPGTHGWLALLSAKNGETVGYLVIHAAEDGSYRLGEYGTGPDVLFSPATLERSLENQGLILPGQASYEAEKIYDHPLAATWQLRIGGDEYWADAKTGQILPFDRAAWERSRPMPDSGGAAANGFGLTGVPDAAILKEPFDPYGSLPWLTGAEPLTLGNGEEARHRILRDERLRYVTEPYGGSVLYALPVVGFQRWPGGRLDVALDMEGIRFIPLETLNAYGLFYP